MPELGLSLNPIQVLDSITDFSGNQARADQQLQQQNTWNKYSHKLDQQKYWFSKQQYHEGKIRDDNKIQRLVKDANNAGVSISTALGANPSAPVQVSIPGHGTRVAGTARAQPIPQAQAQISPAQQHATVSQLNRDRADADFAFYRMLNEKARWEKSRADAHAPPEAYPNRYEFYTDNTKEAIKHYQNGGYVLPAGSSMELPESFGLYNYSRPYVKQSGEEKYYKGEDYFYNNGLGIAP